MTERIASSFAANSEAAEAVSGLTVIETVSAVLSTVPSFTVSEKTSVAAASPILSVGAVKVGCTAVALSLSLNVTVVPEVWVQA